MKVRKIGHYEITAKIGAGGMGEVYRATDTKLGREVALKMLPADMASDVERLDRFRREAKALAALDHPGIVTVFSVEESEGAHFITMQLVEGATLESILPEKGFPLERFLELAVPLADALASAHERGVIHRDLKPANVMVTEDGREKILDFGLAKIGPSAQSADSELPTDLQTREGIVMGTVPYMSPEQVSGQSLDHRTDIFSLGIILYEMACGRRPFQGSSTAELASAILRDRPRPISELRADLPEALETILERCLEKSVDDRFQTVRELHTELAKLKAEPVSKGSRSTIRSAAVRAQEGFWIAVLPFKYRGSEPDLVALAEGLSEDIVTGLSRFSYLRVISRSSTLKYENESYDVRAAGKELGARYVLEGSLRQAGSRLRIASQVVDTSSGAHVWAETYQRTFSPEEIFDLQDEIVPKIVSTIADSHGVLPRTISAALRGKSPSELSPYEAVLRSFGYMERIDAEEHAAVRACLEEAIARAPDDANCLAALSTSYAEEYKHGFNAGPDPLGRALEAARRAVQIAPSNHLAYHALAVARFFRRELSEFRIAAEKAIELNPMDGDTKAFMGILMAYAGDWENGVALAEDALTLNPHHPGWYRFSSFFNAYRKGDYQAALDVAQKINMPTYFATHAALAAAHGQLGQRDAAQRAVGELLAQKPDFPRAGRAEFEKWYFGAGDLLDHFMDGLRKAGLPIPEADDARRDASEAQSTAVIGLAVLPFSDMSASKDQAYLCEGMAEEIMHALVHVEGIRVASRSATFRAERDRDDLPTLGQNLGVSHVLEGSVRTAGDRLRVTAQLIDIESGYQLWSERFDRPSKDIFAVQDEIAAGAVEAVEARLAPGQQTIQPRPRVKNLEAYRHYLQGRHLRYTKNDHRAALESFEQAVTLDPTHAPSWLGVAEVNVLAATNCLKPAGEAYEAARNALAEATRLSGESADALLVEGMLSLCEWKWGESERALRRAVEHSPDHVQALCWLSMLLTILGRFAEAEPFLAQAREVDPLAPYPHAMTGFCFVLDGQRERALEHCERALTFEKDNMLSLWCLGSTLTAQRRPDEAIVLLTSVDPSDPGAFLQAALGLALAVVGRSDEARGFLREIQALPVAGATPPEAWLLEALGDDEEAWRVLEAAEREHHPLLPLVGFPGFDPLRGDERFAALVQRMGLPEPSGAA